MQNTHKESLKSIEKKITMVVYLSDNLQSQLFQVHKLGVWFPKANWLLLAKITFNDIDQMGLNVKT